MQIPIAIGPLLLALLVLSFILSFTAVALFAAARFGGLPEAKPWSVWSLYAATAVIALMLAVFFGSGAPR